jgi:CHASE2 domain-containing sensor protein
MLHDLSPHRAMIASARGVARNWPVTITYFATLTVAVLLASMAPLPLRALVLTPLLTALALLSLYGAYRDIFVGR